MHETDSFQERQLKKSVAAFGCKGIEMAKEFARAFYDSVRWRKCRAAYIAHRMGIDGGLCEACHTEQGYMVHHIIELTPENITDTDITLGFSNLRYECKACHDREEGHFIKAEKPTVQFDAEGNPWPIPPC